MSKEYIAVNMNSYGEVREYKPDQKDNIFNYNGRELPLMALPVYGSANSLYVYQINGDAA